MTVGHPVVKATPRSVHNWLRHTHDGRARTVWSEPARWRCFSPPRGTWSLEGDGGAGALELLLGLVGRSLVDLLEDGLGGAVDEVLGLLETERGERADLLDDLDLLVAGSLEDDVELVLLLGLGRSVGAPPPPTAGPAITGAAAVTPKVSSNCLTNSESSIRVISLKASRSSSVLSFAMMASFLVISYAVSGVKGS
jgi:hypothetical protein